MCKTYYKVDCKEAAWVVLELLYEAVLQACFLFYKDYGGGGYMDQYKGQNNKQYYPLMVHIGS